MSRLTEALAQRVTLSLPPHWPWAAYAALNLGLALYGLRFSDDNLDWQLWTDLPGAIRTGDVYTVSPSLPFVWSPVAAWIMAAVSLLGYWTWVAIHVAVVFLLDRRMIALTLLSWPFWVDAALGNTVTFAFVTGILALRGNRFAGLIYLAMLLLIPRPLQAPLAIWLLWKRPALRLPFAGLFVAHGLLVLCSGQTIEWMQTAIAYGRVVQSIGPPAWFGPAWFAVVLVAAPWLIIHGRVGLAGLLVSPYWLPYYLLVPLIDLRRTSLDREVDRSAVRNPTGP